MEKLKPCPFCGGKGHISSREIRYIGKNYFGAKKIKMGVQIICGRCKARGGLATGEVIYASYQEQRKGLEPLENGAIEAWNMRAELQWIPCSPETMPKKTGYYLVQYTRKYCRNEMAVAFYSVEEARCDDDYTWEIETFSDIKEVIAWMPLPEPYA